MRLSQDGKWLMGLAASLVVGFGGAWVATQVAIARMEEKSNGQAALVAQQTSAIKSRISEHENLGGHLAMEKRMTRQETISQFIAQRLDWLVQAEREHARRDGRTVPPPPPLGLDELPGGNG